jgi:predicted amidohydrolase YtcJ
MRFESLGPSLADRHFRIEHVSIVHDDDLPRLVTLGVIGPMQPNFAGEYNRWAADRVGAARIRSVYRTANLLESGAIGGADTDYPAADFGDPIAALFSIVTRTRADGTPEGGWFANQKVSVSDKLRGMSWAPAYAPFEGHRADPPSHAGWPSALWRKPDPAQSPINGPSAAHPHPVYPDYRSQHRPADIIATNREGTSD